jgi:hypothetical protein
MKLFVVPAILSCSGNVLEYISNENQRHDLKLISNRLRRRGRECCNPGQHFIEQDETEWSRDRRQVVSPYGRDNKWRMRQLPRKKHQYQVNRETGNAQFDGQPFQQGLVGLRKRSDRELELVPARAGGLAKNDDGPIRA